MGVSNLEINSNLIEAHIVREANNKVEFLLLRRSSNQKYPNIWQMVTGKIKDNEKAYSTAIREINEETNISVENLYVVPNVNSFYNSDDDSVNMIPVFVTIVDKNVNVILSDEHQEYKWLCKKEANDLLAWPGQEQSVNIIHDYLSKRKESLNFIEISI